jgi:hypothetical protein
MPNSPWTETGSSISLVPATNSINTPGDANNLTNSDKIALMAQYTAELAMKTSLDTLASTWSVSATAYNNAVAAISTALIAAGAPSNWATTWPDGTTSGPWPGITTSLSNLWAQVATQRTALQSAISNAQAAAAQVTAIATAATNAANTYAASIAAPLVVSSLPALPSALYPTGKLVLLTTTGILYQSTGSTWTTVTVSGSNLTANSITAGQIAAGAIGATQIAAGAITTAALTVCDWTNLCYNPGFENGMTSWTSQQPAQSTISTAQFRSGVQSLKLANNGGTYQVSNSNMVPCAAGQVFLIQAWAMASGTVTSGTFGIRFIFYGSNGSILSGGVSDATFTPTTSWAEYTSTVTAPSGSVSVQCAVIDWALVGGDVYVDDCYFRRCNDSSLIVDGSITATKIATGAITADMITTGTLNAANVAVTNLNASNITTGTLSASKVLFADGTALTTASRIIIYSAGQTSSVTNPVNSVVAVPGLSVSVTAASGSDVFNIIGHSTGKQTAGTAQDLLDVYAYVDNLTGIQTFGVISYGALNVVASNLFFLTLTGLSAGTHTIMIYLRPNNSTDTFTWTASAIQCQRIF